MKSQPQPTTIPIIQINKHSENLDPITIPENCPTCGFPNFNIWGVKQNTILEIKITCMKCGKPHQTIIHSIRKN
jgi:transcription elongation factor Elf1